MAGNSKTAKSVAPKSGRPGASTKGIMVGKNAGKGVVASSAPKAKAPTAKMEYGGTPNPSDSSTANGSMKRVDYMKKGIGAPKKPAYKLGGMKKAKC